MIEIIVIGASAGGVEAVKSLVEHLPSDLNASLFVVMHFPENATSVLPQILNRFGTLKASHPMDGEEIQKGRIYVAPPGFHMLIKGNRISILRGPKENGHRPAIDPLFRSAAVSYKCKVAGIILSGLLDDGVMGLNAIKRLGGTTLVQDPDEALFGDMPRNAISHVEIDKVAPIAELADALVELVNSPETECDPPEAIGGNLDPTEMNPDLLSKLEAAGRPSAYTCPECNGTLFELTENGMSHYRCRVGHSYSPESLENHQAEELEAALWEALKSMEENLALSRRLLERANDGHRPAGKRYYTDKVETGARRVQLLRNLLNQTIEHSAVPKGRRIEA